MDMESCIYCIFFILHFSIRFSFSIYFSNVFLLLCKYMYCIKMLYDMVFSVDLHFLIIEEGMISFTEHQKA